MKLTLNLEEFRTKWLMNKTKRFFFSSQGGGLVGWVGFFICSHDSDLSQLLGYAISSVGGNCVKRAHVKDSIQKILNDQSVTFYVRAEKKGEKNKLLFSSSRCITIIRSLTSLTGGKVSLTHAPMWMPACALTQRACTLSVPRAHTRLDTGSILPAVLKIEK